MPAEGPALICAGEIATITGDATAVTAAINRRQKDGAMRPNAELLLNIISCDPAMNRQLYYQPLHEGKKNRAATRACAAGQETRTEFMKSS